MEVIYGNKKENGELRFPDNIKQVGKDSGRRKVYIEDYVYTFISDLRQDEYDDGLTGLLLGEIKKDKNNTYVFVKGAVEVTNAAVFTDKIAFTEETWPIANSVVAQFFGNMEIVGWYLNSTKITESQIEVINKADRESFSNEDKIFFMVNPETGKKDVFVKDGEKLKKTEGYAVFFEKNEPMQNYMTDMRKTFIGSRSDTDEETGRYRKIINKNSTPSKGTKRNFTIIYGLSMVLLILVLVIGINKINNYDKMKENLPANNVVEKETDKNNEKETTPVETVPGDITTVAETEPETEPQTEKQTEKPTEKPTEPPTEKPTEAPTEAPYDTYTVQMGDNFIKICRQFYGTESMADVGLIRAANNMTETDELLVGAVIKIPRK